MKILVVDDSTINLKVTTKILEKEGYEVDNALSGFECLKMVKENHQGIVLDIDDYEYHNLDEVLEEDFVVVLDHLD